MPFVQPDNRSPAPHIPGCAASDWRILIAIAGMILVIFSIDAITPVDQPVWLFYFIPLFLAYWSGRASAIPAVFLVTVFFLLAGFILSPQSIPVQMAVSPRFVIFLNVFFILSLVLWIVRMRQIREDTSG